MRNPPSSGVHSISIYNPVILNTELISKSTPYVPRERNSEWQRVSAQTAHTTNPMTDTEFNRITRHVPSEQDANQQETGWPGVGRQRRHQFGQRQPEQQQPEQQRPPQCSPGPHPTTSSCVERVPGQLQGQTMHLHEPKEHGHWPTDPHLPGILYPGPGPHQPGGHERGMGQVMHHRSTHQLITRTTRWTAARYATGGHRPTRTGHHATKPTSHHEHQPPTHR